LLLLQFSDKLDGGIFALNTLLQVHVLLK